MGAQTVNISPGTGTGFGAAPSEGGYCKFTVNDGTKNDVRANQVVYDATVLGSPPIVVEAAR